MVKIPNKLVIFGAVAAAALVGPGLAGPLMFDEAYAQASPREQSNRASQTADDTLINVQAAVQANIDDVNVCVIVEECD
jgi:predicted small lipoprotein YifL